MAFVFIVGAAFAAVFGLRDALVDDAFIYLRVADNFAAGHGWTYNIGEQANPCTSFLFPLALAFLRWCGVPPSSALLGVYGFGVAVVGCAIFAMLRDRRPGLGAVLACAAMFEVTLLHSVGMETSCFVGAVLLWGGAAQRRCFGGAGALAAVATLLRPDGVALLAILIGGAIVAGGDQRRPILVRVIAGFLGVFTPFAILLVALSGGLVPSSVGVKMAQSGVGWWAERPAWLSTWLRLRPAPYLSIPLALWFLVRNVRLQREIGLSLVMVFALVQMFTYAAMSAPESYFWYFAPSNIAFNVAALYGAVEALELLGGKLAGVWGGRFRAPYPTFRRDCAVCGVVLALLYGVVGVWSRPPYLNAREYTEVGRWLAEHAAPTDRVAAAEIGYIGFFSQRSIVDMHGLIHPGALAEIKKGDPAWWFRLNQPQWIVTHEPAWFGEPGRGWEVAAQGEFEARYAPAFRSGKITVWGRRG